HVEDSGHATALEHLIRRIELRRLREMADVTGVNQEIGRCRHCGDALDGLPERADHVAVRGLVESDVAVADLHEAEVAGRLRATRSENVAQSKGLQNAAL